jgi:hypothetical protein
LTLLDRFRGEREGEDRAAAGLRIVKPYTTGMRLDDPFDDW